MYLFFAFSNFSLDFHISSYIYDSDDTAVTSCTDDKPCFVSTIKGDGNTSKILMCNSLIKVNKGFRGSVFIVVFEEVFTLWG